ncbi:MAG: SpaA isopeptide-forming pilin-related protein [Coprococcus sp.]
MPDAGGEVCAVTYCTNPSSTNRNYVDLVKDSTGLYVPKNTDGELVSFEFGSESSDIEARTISVLTRWPKESGDVNRSLRNDVEVTCKGIDGNAEDVDKNTDGISHSWTGATTVYNGNVWGIIKWGIQENNAAAITMLENGGDKEFAYYLDGVGHTYVYGNFDNYSAADYPNSANTYNIELIDDFMYMDGCGDGQTYRLGEEDYYYTGIDINVVDYKVDGILPTGQPDRTERTSDDMKPVSVYVMKKGSSEWTLYQTIEPSGSWKKWEGGPTNTNRIGTMGNRANTTNYYALPYGTVSFNKEEGIYRFKVVYDADQGDTCIRLKIHGCLDGDGTNVQTAIQARNANSSADPQSETVNLYNWGAIRGLDSSNRLLNGAGADNITGTPVGVKNDLLVADSELYGYTGGIQSQRSVATNVLKRADVYVGAGKGAKKTVTGNNITVRYDLIATEFAGAKLESDAKAQVESGVLKGNKQVIFYDLLPQGMEYSSYSTISSINGAASGYGFNYDWGFDGTTYGTVEKLERLDEIKAPVNVEVNTTDNYNNSGRQMVEIKLTYDEAPIGRIGKAYVVWGCIYGIKLVAKTTPADIVGYGRQAVNRFAASFHQEAGAQAQNCYTSAEHASSDDGTYFDLKNKDGQNVFANLCSDGNASIVNSDVTVDFDDYPVSTGVVKSVRNDDEPGASYGSEAKIRLDGNYSYRLRFTANTQSTCKDLAIFDTIEEAYDDNPYWKGTLTGVDITEAKNEYGTVDVYVNTRTFTPEEYATDIDDSSHPGITYQDLVQNKNGWTKINPETYNSWNTVKSIAFYFPNQEFGTNTEKYTAVVYLKMKGISHLPEGQDSNNIIWAYNEPAYCISHAGSTVRTSLANTVKVQTEFAPVTYQPTVMKRYDISDRGTWEGLPTNKSFTIYFESEKDASGNSVKIPMPDGNISTSSSVPVNITENDVDENGVANVAVPVGEIAFTQPGTYVYNIREYISGLTTNTVVYDQSKYRMTIKVVVSTSGSEDKLVIDEVKYEKITDAYGNVIEPAASLTSSDIVFENKDVKDASKATAILPVVSKKLSGKLPQNFSKTYTFEVTPEDNAPVPVDAATGESKTTASVIMTETGTKQASEFGVLTFEEPGTYSYVITEQNDEDEDGICDKSQYRVTYTVRKYQYYSNNTILYLDKAATVIERIADSAGNIFDEAQETNGDVVFDNTYIENRYKLPVELPVVKKKLTGDVTDGFNAVYTFKIKAKGDSPVPENDTVSITMTEEGSAYSGSFGEVIFTKPGTYEYEITEVAGNDSNTVYDGEVYSVTYKVTENDSPKETYDKAIRLAGTVIKKESDGTVANAVVFENVYKLGSIRFVKTGLVNELCSDNPDETQRLNDVTFALYAEDDQDMINPIATSISKNVDGEDGIVVFDNLTVGKYLIKETATVNNYVVDTNVYTAEVTADNLDTYAVLDNVTDNEIVNDVYRTDISFTKVNESAPEEKIAGAKYGLYVKTENSDGEGTEKCIATGVTDENGVLSFEGVFVDKEYIIREEEASAGSYLSKQPISVICYRDDNGGISMELTDAGINEDNGKATAYIDENGNLTWLEPSVLYSFIKEDEDGNRLEGAELKICDAQGVKIDSWITDGNIHELNGVLKAGETYTLTETKAPNGYLVADDVEFTVSDNSMAAGESAAVVITMVDKKDTEVSTDDTTEVTTDDTTEVTTDDTTEVTTSDTTEVTTDDTTETTTESTTEPGGDTPQKPKTGDNMNGISWILLIFALAGAAVCIKRRNKI